MFATTRTFILLSLGLCCTLFSQTPTKADIQACRNDVVPMSRRNQGTGGCVLIRLTATEGCVVACNTSGGGLGIYGAQPGSGKWTFLSGDSPASEARAASEDYRKNAANRARAEDFMSGVGAATSRGGTDPERRIEERKRLEGKIARDPSYDQRYGGLQTSDPPPNTPTRGAVPLIKRSQSPPIEQVWVRSNVAQYIAVAPKHFEPFKKGLPIKDAQGRNTWDSLSKPAFAQECYIVEDTTTTTVFACSVYVDKIDVIAARYEELVAHVAASLPTDWKEIPFSAGGTIASKRFRSSSTGVTALVYYQYENGEDFSLRYQFRAGAK